MSNSHIRESACQRPADEGPVLVDQDDESGSDPEFDDDKHHLLSSLDHRLTGGSSSSKMNSKSSNQASRFQGRDDRATSEHVLDPVTRKVLFKLLANHVLETLHGCISTGKEANVYYAQGYSGSERKQRQHYAVKVYKTSILDFARRDRYVIGERRWFQYSTSSQLNKNPRNMVQVWAEKEFRNYKRCSKAGLPCPRPLLLKRNVLVMEFLGQQSEQVQDDTIRNQSISSVSADTETGWPSPRLKDAFPGNSMSSKRRRRQLHQAYLQTLLILRHLYQDCRLVHGDLSEYNLLWHYGKLAADSEELIDDETEEEVYVIDVSQAVEQQHVSAMEFLEADVRNVSTFFRKKQVDQILTQQQALDFCLQELPEHEDSDADSSSSCHAEWTLLQNIVAPNGTTKSSENPDDPVSRNQATPQIEPQWLDEGVFSKWFDRCRRRRSLQSRENEALGRQLTSTTPGKGSKTKEDSKNESAGTTTRTLATTRALDPNHMVEPPVADEREYEATPVLSDKERMHSDEGDDDVDYSSDDSDSSDSWDPNLRRKLTPEEREQARLLQKEQRKANKKQVKDAARERRKTKIKKKEKKKAIKKAKAGNRKNR